MNAGKEQVQNEVDTNLEYFLRQLPNVRRLAAAPLGEVLKLWEGLGYYARARNLHRAAGEIVRRHGGRFPRDVREIRRLSSYWPGPSGCAMSRTGLPPKQNALKARLRRSAPYRHVTPCRRETRRRRSAPYPRLTPCRRETRRRRLST